MIRRHCLGRLSATLVAVAAFAWCSASDVRAQRTNVDGIGVTEWEEWSFADKNWWAQVAGDQTRTDFTLGQGVVAIADPDEWDDRGGPSASYTFNSQLLSPVIDVSNATSLSLEFASSWRPEVFQTASVEVIYDGVPAELFRWTSQTGADFHPDSQNELVNVNIPSPNGASEMRLAFNLFDAGNNWWWAIDNVKVFDNGGSIFTEDFESVTLGPAIDEAQSEDPVFSQDGPSGWIVNTDTYFPPVQNRTQPRHPPSITRDIPPQDPPLVLQVDPNTGLAQLLSTADEVVRLTSYSVTSELGAVDVAAWEQGNLTARNLDPVDGGTGPGDRWEVVNADPFQAFEAFLSGGTDIAPGESLSIGRVYDPSVGGEDLVVDFTAVFTDRFDQYIPQSTDEKSTAGEDVFAPVVVEYVAIAGLDGDFDQDGDVDGADFIQWQRDAGASGDLADWEANFGVSLATVASRPTFSAVPEPAQLGLVAAVAAAIAMRRRRVRRRLERTYGCSPRLKAS